VSSRHDEFRRQPVTAQIAGASGVVHPDGQILVDLEMKVGGVHAVVVPDGADQLSARDLLSFPHMDPVQMGVE
jgi:apolipoprotein N-acyltransferase